MRRKYKLIALLLAIPLAVVAAYYYITPKAIVTNLSDTTYDEFVITLPTSQVSFSPIEANSSSTIFYSRQHQSGTVRYSLKGSDSVIFNSELPYAEGSEIGRVLHFTITGDGQVMVNN